MPTCIKQQESHGVHHDPYIAGQQNIETSA